MKTDADQSNLQALEQELQLLLQQIPISVRCVLRQGVLMVLAQHIPEDSLDSQQTFSVLTQAIEEFQPNLTQELPGKPAALSVRLYLRTVGQQKPYALHAFTLTSGLTPSAANEMEESAANQAKETSEKLDFAQGAETSGEMVFLEDEPEAIAPPSPSNKASDHTAASDDSPSTQPLLSRPLSLWVTGAAAGLIVLFGGLVVLTRPCVIGKCVPLQAAQRLQQASMQTVQPTASAQDVAKADEQLNQAIYLLSTIPPWSHHYSTAQALMQTYEAQSALFEQLKVAQQKAIAAAQKSQNPPHPLAVWRETQGLWREAIASLKQISLDSPVYPLTQRKLTEYQGNLAAIDQRILREQQAQKQVTAARSVAGVADARQGVANSVQSWQLARATWQVTLNLLQQIPQGTMAYAEAQQLLTIYQTKLAAVRDRTTQEEISARAYRQAIGLAEQAQLSEHRQQWSQAVDQWRNALTYAQQVPTGTSYASQAQPLVASYNTAVTQAQESLQTVVTLQTAADELNRTCNRIPRICTYTLAADLIRVQITPNYDQAVERAIATTQLTSDETVRAEVAVHVNALLRAIASISQTAQVPIELRNADGSLFGTYVPSLSGYVQH